MTPRTLSQPRRPLDAQLRASLAAVAATGAVLALGALALVGPAAAFSVAVGAALATANLWVLARIVTALLPGEDPAESGDGPAGGAERAGARRAGAWAVLGIVKMFALFAVVLLLMRSGAVSALPMLVGFGALPIGIAIGSLVRNRGA